MELTGYSGLFGLIVLALDILAIANIVTGSHSTLAKIVWIVVVLALPVLGMIIYFLFGRRRA
jgi:hypothetical protein